MATGFIEPCADQFSFVGMCLGSGIESFTGGSEQLRARLSPKVMLGSEVARRSGIDQWSADIVQSANATDAF